MPFVCLTEDSYKRIEGYAEAAGISVQRAVSEAVGEWMDTTGDAVMAVLRKRRSRKKTVTCIAQEAPLFPFTAQRTAPN